MNHILRLPYYIPSTERISVGQWGLVKNGDIYSLDTLLPDWDPAMSLHFFVNVELDFLGILEDCHLTEDTNLRLTTLWESSGTMLQGRGDVIDLNRQHHRNQLRLHMYIEGIKLAKSLDLIVCLIILKPSSNIQPFTPKLPGSILFQRKQTVLLEGEGARFPIEIIDFAQTHYPSEAGWVLYWEQENLHQTVLGDTRLYVNERHTRVVRAISENRPEDYGIREAIRLDIARTLILGALNNEEFVDNPKIFKHDSIGAAIRNMVAMYFPDMSLTQLRDNSKHPQSFEPKLQERFRVFWGE